MADTQQISNIYKTLNNQIKSTSSKVESLNGDNIYNYIRSLGTQHSKKEDQDTATLNLHKATDSLLSSNELTMTSWSEILDDRVSKVYNTSLYKPSMFIPVRFEGPAAKTTIESVGEEGATQLNESATNTNTWLGSNLHLIHKIEGLQGLDTGVVSIDDATSSFKFNPGNTPYKHQLSIKWIEDAFLSVTKAHTNWQRIIYNDAAHTVKSFKVATDKALKENLSQSIDAFGALGLAQYTPLNNTDVGVCGKIVIAGLFPTKIDKPFNEIGPGVKSKELQTVTVHYTFAKAWYTYYDENGQQVMVLSN